MARAIETNASDVTREDGTGIRIVQRKVVIRVSWSVVCAQCPCTRAQIGVILENTETFRWYRNHLTPERSHQIAVYSRRARHQFGRIYHVRRADWMYVQSCARQYTEQRSGTARMIEMYVSHHDSLDICRIEACLANAGKQRSACTGRPSFDQRQCIAVSDQIRCDDARRAPEMMVEQKYTRLDLSRETVGCWSMINGRCHLHACSIMGPNVRMQAPAGARGHWNRADCT